MGKVDIYTEAKELGIAYLHKLFEMDDDELIVSSFVALSMLFYRECNDTSRELFDKGMASVLSLKKKKGD